MENSQIPTKPMVIENSAGEVYGNGADPAGLPSVASQTEGESTVSTTEEMRPRKPPTTAPFVVQSFHRMERKSTGKLADAATAKASDTMKAMFCFSKTMPRMTARMPRQMVVIRETLSSALIQVGVVAVILAAAVYYIYQRGVRRKEASDRISGRETPGLSVPMRTSFSLVVALDLTDLAPH